MEKIRLMVAVQVILLLCSCQKQDGSAPAPGVNKTDTMFTDYKKPSAALTELYTRQVYSSSIDGNAIPDTRGAMPAWALWTDFSEAFPLDNSSLSIVQRTGWPFDSWTLDWNKCNTYIHDPNAFMVKDSLSAALNRE